jgi:hypothetical protein
MDTEEPVREKEAVMNKSQSVQTRRAASSTPAAKRQRLARSRKKVRVWLAKHYELFLPAAVKRSPRDGVVRSSLISGYEAPDVSHDVILHLLESGQGANTPNVGGFISTCTNRCVSQLLKKRDRRGGTAADDPENTEE